MATSNTARAPALHDVHHEQELIQPSTRTVPAATRLADDAKPSSELRAALRRGDHSGLSKRPNSTISHNNTSLSDGDSAAEVSPPETPLVDPATIIAPSSGLYDPAEHRRRIYTWRNVSMYSTAVLVITPILAIVGLLTVPLRRETIIWSIAYYFFTGLGITAGYHRYWSHRSYDAKLPLRILLMCAGSGAVEGSIKWWSRHHRAHHRFTDSRLDPYAPQHGFWHSHILWMMFKEQPEDRGKVSIDDIMQDPVVRFQHRHYTAVIFIFGFILPTLVAGLLWGDYAGGFFYAAITRLIFVHHATFCVNSLAHWLGETSFDDRYSPRDHVITAVVTLGEGYHNFHHEFPNDFRNAIQIWQYDPTKWLISVFAYLGLATNLRVFPENEIQKGKLAMQEKKIQILKAKLDYGKPLETLKRITFAEFRRQVKEERKRLLVIEGVVYDVERFIDIHPGGRMFILSGIGRDVTASFNGGVYNHHYAARNLLQSLRYAVLEDDVPAELVAKEE